MKTEKNIFVAFLLNLGFSVFELIGGMMTNSIAIMSDAVHDFGDALSIGIAFMLEKKSKRKPDEKYTYGYARYSILGAFITTVILVIGSVLVIGGGVGRIMNPAEVRYDEMIILAVVGVAVNFIAAYKTSKGASLNQKSVNLHLLEDVLGWVVVLVGAILMKIMDISILDPIMSIGVALFILINACRNFRSILDLFLAKVPEGLSVKEIERYLGEIKGVRGVHHLHLWSMDGGMNYATVHIVTETKDAEKLKKAIRAEAAEHGIGHITIELETPGNECSEKECRPQVAEGGHGAGGHHH